MSKETGFAVFDEYAEWTNTVAQYPVTAEAYYLALGITDELGELYAARGRDNILKELGDVCWYVARYAKNVLKIPFSMILYQVDIAGQQEIASCVVSTGVISGVEKKRIRDGAEWTMSKTAAKNGEAQRAIVDIMRFVMYICNVESIPLEKVVETNQKKLSKRLEEGSIKGDGDNR